MLRYTVTLDVLDLPDDGDNPAVQAGNTMTASMEEAPYPRLYTC